MKKKLLQILACPYDKGSRLSLKIKKEKNGEVIEGALVCRHCQRVYPIIKKTPYLLSDDLMSSRQSVSSFFKRNREYRSGLKFYFHQRKTDPGWQEGERVWHPDIVSKIGTAFRMKYPPSLIKDYFNSSSFSLDVGCGEHPRGDVNMDIYEPAEIPENFVLASAEYLPFGNNVFDLVFSSYVIEHCLNPALFLKDHLRCSKKRIVVVTDNSEWFGDAWCRFSGNGRIFHDEHCYAWTVEYLENLARRLGFRSKVKACNLSPTYITILASKLGRLPRVGRFFYRDLVAEVFK